MANTIFMPDHTLVLSVEKDANMVVTHSIIILCHQTLSTHPPNIPYQYTLPAHPIIALIRSTHTLPFVLSIEKATNHNTTLTPS